MSLFHKARAEKRLLIGAAHTSLHRDFTENRMALRLEQSR